MSETPSWPSDGAENKARDGFSRRRFVKTSAVAGSILAVGGSGTLLSACGQSSSGTTTGGATGGKPKQGGILKFGSNGGSDTESLEGQNPIVNPDFARVYQMYTPLVDRDKDGKLAYGLATEITPNKSATLWTIKLREGVEFHNGKTLTAEDVLFSFNRIVQEGFSGSFVLEPLDLKNAKAVDKTTLQIPTKTPYSTFLQVLASSPYFTVVPVGYDPKSPVGTGPFQYVSFTPGQQSVVKRFPNFWETGKPYVDEIITISFTEEQSQINALLGGQVDLTDYISATSVDTVENGGAQTLISKSTGFTSFPFRVDQEPFTDVRVRQAMKLSLDRPQMNELLFAGNGIVANDIFGYGDPLYDTSIPQRQYDPEQAKSLLTQAGHGDGIDVQLVTAPLTPNLSQQAQLIVQSAAASGIKISIKNLSISNWTPNYLNWTFSVDSSYAGYYMGGVPLLTANGAPFNETHFADPKYNSLYQEVLATTDESLQKTLAGEMQQIEYDQGGLLIPVFTPIIDGFNPNVHGLLPGKNATWAASNYRFQDIWLD